MNIPSARGRVHISGAACRRIGLGIRAVAASFILDAWAKGQKVLLQAVASDVATGLLSPVVEAIGTAALANRLRPMV